MSSLNGDVSQNGNTRNTDGLFTVGEVDEIDFSKLTNRPKPLNMERQRSFDERSLSELSVGFSPRLSARHPENSSRYEHPEYLFSPCSNCGEVGHGTRTCTQPRNMNCFICKQPGHIARNCTQNVPVQQVPQPRMLPPAPARVFAVGQGGTGVAGFNLAGPENQGGGATCGRGG